MNTERDKFLTEMMGKKWYEDRDGLGWKVWNYNFSAWNEFGELWTWAQQNKWWAEFVNQLVNKELTKAFPAYFIHPDRFADAVYHFLKGRQP